MKRDFSFLITPAKFSFFFQNRFFLFSIKFFILSGLIIFIFTSFNTPQVDQNFRSKFLSYRDLPKPNPVYFGTWENMTSGVAYGTVHTIEPDDQGNLFVGGSFSIAGGLQESYFAKWDGSSWGTSPGATAGFGGWINDLAWANDGNLYATGDFESAWILDDLGHIAGSNNGGKHWYAMGEGFSYLGLILMTDVYGRLYAGGHFGSADGQYVNGLVRWHEDHWENFEPSMYFDVKGMVADKNGVFYGAGYFYSNELGIDASHGVVRYDGNEWIHFGEADHIIADIALDTAGNVIVVGTFWNIDNVEAYHMAKWDGEIWQSIDVPAYYQPEQVIVDGDNNIYIGGSKPGDSGFWDGFVIRWNGQYWEQLGQPFNYPTVDIAIDAVGNLYAAGNFDNNSLYHIAQFSEQVTPFPAYPPQVLVKDEDLELSEDILVFPNPSSGTINLESPENLSEIIIFDVSGKEALKINKVTNEIDVSGLSPGIYFVHLKQKDKSTIVKIVVE